MQGGGFLIQSVYKYINHILIVLLFVVSLNVQANNDEKNTVAIASSFVEANKPFGEDYCLSGEVIKIAKGKSIMAFAFIVKPSGFVVINANSNQIVAYSFKSQLPNVNSSEWILFSSFVSGIKTKTNDRDANAPADNILSVGPFVYSFWGQVNCKDNYGNTVNVTNTFTPNNYAVGCVAVSMSTVMKHYDWPLTGVGSHTYTDNYGSSNGTYSANFGETEYPWDNILNRYNNKPSTKIEKEAAGLLNFHSAVALEMDFEYNGSTSNVNRIPNAGRNYFRYSSQNRYPSSSVFWPLLDSNMMHEIPVVLAIAGNGYGHSIVCDGMRIDEDSTFYYHLNMGWWGSANGWYRLKEDWNAGGYSEITGGVFNFLPIPSLETPYFEETSDSITVKWEYPETKYFNAFELQQKIDGGSWETLVDTLTQKHFTVFVDPEIENKFRVKAQNNGLWGTDSWSMVETAIWDNTGIFENYPSFEISVSPNPANNFIRVHSPTNIKNCQIQIFELSGKEVFRTAVLNELNNQTIDVSKLKSGFYILNCKTEETASSIKFIKL